MTAAKASFDLFMSGLVFGLGVSLAWCMVSFAWTELVQKVRRG